jgi:hypothetical protein
MHVTRRTKAVGAGAGLATLAAVGGQQYLSNWGPRLLPAFESSTARVGTFTASEVFGGTAATRIAPFAGSQPVSSGIGTKFTGYTVPKSYAPLGTIEGAPAPARALTPPVPQQSDQFAKLQPLGKVGDRPNLTNGQISPPKPLVVPGPLVHSYQNDTPSAAANFFSRVEPKMVDDLASLHRPLKFDYARSVVYNDLKSAAQQAEKEPAAKVSFEVLTGKIKIDASKTIAGVKISGGEINVYKTSMTIGAAVIACNAVADNRFKDCIADAAKKAIKKALEKETETAAGK